MSRIFVDRLASVALAVSAVLVLLGVGASTVMKTAADDLNASVDLARGRAIDHPRTNWDIWLSTQFSADIQDDDFAARSNRGYQLAYRSERMREGASVLALVALLGSVLTGRPARARVGHEAITPTANTVSNGSA